MGRAPAATLEARGLPPFCYNLALLEDLEDAEPGPGDGSRRRAWCARRGFHDGGAELLHLKDGKRPPRLTSFAEVRKIVGFDDYRAEEGKYAS